MLGAAEAPPPVPAAVRAALPPGVPESVAIRNTDGCWLYSVEVTDPPSGFPLRDAAGNQLCGDGTAAAAVVAGPDASALVPTTLASDTPVGDETRSPPPSPEPGDAPPSGPIAPFDPA
jgi:hypothetical protein